MELEELKDIWKKQDQQDSITLNNELMNQQIRLKRNKAIHISRFSEMLLIGVNVGSGIFIMTMTDDKSRSSYFLYAMAIWMLLQAVFVGAASIVRHSRDRRFDRNISGQLDHALATARYQVRLSQLMKFNIIPIASISVLAMWDGGRSVIFVSAIVVFFAITFYLQGFEHRLYVNRKAELENLRTRLDGDQLSV